MWNETVDVVNHSVSDCGLALILFLRYLGSQQFSMCHSLDLSLQDGRPMPYPILMRQPTWEPLHQVSGQLFLFGFLRGYRVLQLAFRTYHHIAVSGRFDAIYVGDIIQDWSESESR